MKIPTFAILFLCCVATLTTAQHNAKLMLADGSVIHGQIHMLALPVETFFGTVPVPVEKMVRIEFANAAKLSLADGSILHGNIPVPALPVETLFGAVPIPLEKVTHIEFVKVQKMVPANHDPRLIYWNTFDSEEELREMGEWKNGRLVKGKSGMALHTDGKVDVYKITIPPHTFKPKGCIEFWAKIEPEVDSFAGNTFLRFFWMSHTRLEFLVNNGMAAGGITSYCGNSVVGSSRFGGQSRYSEVLGPNYKDWHHYALVWNDEGLDIGEGRQKPYSAIYINGKRVSSLETNRGNMGGKFSLPAGPDKELSIVIASSAYMGDPNLLNPVPFAIDDFKIWNYDKTEFDGVTPAPVNPVTVAPGW